MSIGAALSLAKVIDHFENGTVVVIGCPGELINGTKVTMAKQGTFQDIDVVLMAHPDTENAFLNTSMALLPVKIKYYGKEALTNSVNGIYSSLDACAFTFNSLSFLAKGFEKNCSISELTIKSNDNPHLPPKASEINFNIRAPKMFQACLIENKIKLLAAAVADLMEVDHDITMPELPYDEIVSNNTLSRIFAHNLKEIGIIDTINPKDTFAGLSLGTLSHLVPCIQLYISIVKDLSIKYSTADFAVSTISPFAQDNVLKAASALAMTGLDLLEKEELLQEVKVEFYENLKNHECTTCSQ
jgi:metal-dependent amidase/aminoacylase/carboxypeptidase family protein